jgi:alpha-tubulin suppressor-like RCC1 family protein
VYALGEGRRGQLGFGNQFTGALKKGGVYQAFPRMTTPSGAYTYKTDLKIGQVACGGSFSIAREISTEEGVDTSIGFRELEYAFLSLKATYYESNSIQQAWSTIRQERFKISRQAEGQLLVWGTGEHGELGLGVLGKLSLYPQPVWKLRYVCITHVAAGNRHVLAVDDRGRLFSWGCGTDGRLGHGDFQDRDRPELVMFFASLFVETCAAGDAHSAVLTTMRAGSRSTQLRRISTFGRGAHGRLGNGTNRNMCSPVLVSKWLPSLQKVQFHQLACGGAHTLVLASQVVPQGIANPRGLETFVVAWGYGKNGQLGTGYRYDSFVPVKARMPRWDIITEISAGRSWSMAKSAGGEVYTWGKGLRGQLGQGPEKFCLAPRKIESFASFVHISSGYAHNVAITTPKKFLSTELTEHQARHDGSGYKPLEPYVKATLRRANSTSLFAFDCCRRNAAPWKKKTRFRCLDCMCASICLLCAKLCHRGHRVILLDTAEVAVLDDPEAAEPEVHTSDYMPYRCAVMFLTHPSVLRPKRGSLECMPRPSILDLSSLLKKATPLGPGQKPEVRRRNRENTKEDEVNPRYLEVDRSLHHFVKTVVPKKEAKKPDMDRKFRCMTKVKVVAKKGTGPEIIETVVAAPVVVKVPCCRCGVFNQQCRVIPVIPEHPDEDVLHLEEMEATKKAAETAKANGTHLNQSLSSRDATQLCAC